MAIYNRYQPLHGAQQHLYCEGCPVYVHRYQISADLQTGDRMLQVRMVNMSEWEISTVFLRIACLDGNGRAISTMYAVPVTNVHASRGSIFGESEALRLSASAAQSVQVFPERVVFANGAAWNETEQSSYVSIPAPLSVRPTDPDFDRLERLAQHSGVHNEYRYQELENAWYCSCGLPNGTRRQFCGYCGTNREWLRLNMNGRVSRPKPVELPPAPEETPAPEEKPVQKKEPALPPPVMPEVICWEPETFEPQEKELALPEEEFPVIEPQPPKSSAGKVLGIILLVLAIAATAAFCIFRFLMPQLRYNQANDLELAGNYAEAREIFTELGDYSDAPERVTGTWYQEGLAQMRAGNYEAAYLAFVTIPDFENSRGYAADCLYSQGVLAFNGGDPHTAWDFCQRLENEYPEYEKSADLNRSCSYSFGDEEMNAGNYEEAKSWFVLAGDYKNSAELAEYCDYEIACAARDSGDYELAAEAFRTCSYGDSVDQMYQCMMLYVEQMGSREDPLTETYLTELCSAEYEGAVEMYDQIFGWRIQITVTDEAEPGDAPAECTEVDNPVRLSIVYSVAGGKPEQTISIVILYTMPDGTSGNLFLVSDASDDSTGTVRWSDLQFPECTAAGNLILKFCDSESGEELYNSTVAVTAAQAAEDEGA